jgi:hypothetical protein
MILVFYFSFHKFVVETQLATSFPAPARRCEQRLYPEIAGWEYCRQEKR